MILERGSRIPRMKDRNCETRDKTSLNCSGKLHGEKGYLGGSVLMQYNFEEILTAQAQVSLSTALQVLLQRFPCFFPQPPPSFSLAGNTGEKFNDLSGNQLIFILGREEWVECIDVQTQTTALCVLETPDTWRNECQITKLTARTTVQMHTWVMQHETYINTVLRQRWM